MHTPNSCTSNHQIIFKKRYKNVSIHSIHPQCCAIMSGCQYCLLVGIANHQDNTFSRYKVQTVQLYHWLGISMSLYPYHTIQWIYNIDIILKLRILFNFKLVNYTVLILSKRCNCWGKLYLHVGFNLSI